ncbi:MAG TPA: GGDEF domain-containing protein [Burkholderiaceae bacterium]|nr:GGDEF domain-containing protein [Burkholderiaceae bacterium]
MSIGNALKSGLRPMWMIGITLVILLVSVSAYVANESQQRQRQHVERELQVINQLQRQSVQAWYDQRLTDAAVLMDDTALSKLVQDALHEAPDQDAVQTRLQSRLQGLLERHNYTGVWLADPDGSIRFSSTAKTLARLPGTEYALLAQVFSRAEAAIVPPRHDNTFEYPFLSVLVPLFHDGERIAAIWLIMDVRLSLYPIMERWPVRRTTAGSALVMRDGDEASYLSPTSGPDSPVTLPRVSLNNGDLPAVKAVEGMRGLFTGLGSDGTPMIAVASSLRGVPWVLLSTVRLEEAMLGEWNDFLRLIAPIVLTLLTAAVVIVYAQRLAWRRERELKLALQAQVRIDGLTSVANRRALNERLLYEWNRASRQRTSLSVLMIDVDHFKLYNDAYGHLRGDDTLKQVAALVTSVVTRSVDMVARYGGEEFVVVMPDTNGEQAVAMATRICAEIRRVGIEHRHPETQGVVTVSIGVAVTNPGKPVADTTSDDGAITLLKQADTALYRAKALGRGQVVLYHPEMETPSSSRG